MDTSTIKSILKKDARVLARRSSSIYSKNQISRKRSKWIKELEKDIQGHFIEYNRTDLNKNEILISTLATAKDGKHLQPCYIRINKKICNVSIYSTKIVITEHFLIRVIQSSQSESITNTKAKNLLKKLVCEVNLFIWGNENVDYENLPNKKSIKALDLCITEINDTQCDIVVPTEYGVIVIFMDNSSDNPVIILKTFIPIDSILSGKNLHIMRKMGFM